MQVTALSVVAPSGMKVARGLKRLEIRRWRPKALPVASLLIVENQRFLRVDGDEDPHGSAVAVVTIDDVHPWREDEMQIACASYFEPGLFAWTISNVRVIVQPFTVPARRGLYEVEVDEADYRFDE